MKIIPKHIFLLLALLTSGVTSMGQNTNPAAGENATKPKKGLQVYQEPDWEQIARDNEAAFKDLEKELQQLQDKYDTNKVHDDTEGVPQEIIDMLDSYAQLMKVSDGLEKLRDQNPANAANTQSQVPPEKKTTDEEPDWDQIARDNQAAFVEVDEELKKLRDKYDPNKKHDDTEGVPQEIIDMLDSYGQLVKTTEMLEKLREQNEKNAAATNPAPAKPVVPGTKNLPPAPLMATAKGTGQTTGHIANINVNNKGNTPIQILPQMVYIPSDGKYQPYAASIPATTIPPKTDLMIPVSGYCADVHTPPVPAGETLPPIASWIALEPPSQPDGEPPSIAIVEHIVPPFSPFDIPSVINSPGFIYEPVHPTVKLDPTWPGTLTPLNGHIDPVHYPETFAPIIIDALQNISTSFDRLRESGEITTPFNGDPKKEKEAVIQQTFWIYTAALSGKKYEKEIFGNNVIKQFETNTGTAIANIPEKDKENLNSGIDDFWKTFTAVGTEAKVLSEGNAPVLENQPIMAAAGTSDATVKACGSIKGKVTTDPEQYFKMIGEIVVYVTSDCDFCPPKPDYEPVVIKENEDGLQPSFVVVPKDSSITLVNDQEKDIVTDVHFQPSPVDGTRALYPPVLKKGERTVVTPTKSPSGSYSDDYLLQSNINKRFDAKVLVTPNRCYSIADKDGNYAIGKLPPGNYHLKVYTRSKRTNFPEADVVVEEGKVTIKDFVLDREVTKKEEGKN